MIVALVQFRPEFGNIKRNIDKAFSMMENVDADLFVLPELCFSGYTFTSREEASSLSEPAADGFTVNQIVDFSSRKNAAIVYGFPEKDDDSLYNSCSFISPDGEIHTYRKLHLYYYENEWFSPGNIPLNVLEYRGGKLGMMICFDWIFPEVCRTLALKGAQLICHPSNLVMSFCQQSMITRCLENRIFSITANRTGREKRGKFEFDFTGASRIVSPSGEVLYQGSIDKDEIGIADIDLEKSNNKKVNFKNDLWMDRRPEFYRMEPNGEE
jgi:predicted amidohydrolase